MIKPGTLLSKITALSILFLLLYLIFSALDIFVVHKYLTLKNETLQLREFVGRYEERKIDLKQLEQNVSRIKQNILSQKIYLENEKQSVMLAKLQNKIKSIFRANRSQILKIQLVPVSKNIEPKRLTIGLRAVTTPSQLKKILYKIETLQPVLIVEKLSIQPNILEKNKQSLKIDLEISGFLKG